MKILAFLTLVSVCSANDIALQEFINGNNLFTAAIYREVAKEADGNFLISPLSIQTVLALTQSGAKDETAYEIRTGLRLPNTTERTEAVYANLIPALRGNQYYALSTANKIYVQNGYPIKDTYRNIATKIYQAGIESVNFGAKVQTADNINNWVEQKTNNKIKNLIDPESIGDTTRLVLINALYFKGKWVFPFDKYSTTKKDFFRSTRDVVQVDTMHTTELFNYYESPELNAKFLELPYEGNDVSMVIVLPNEIDGLRTLEARIDEVFQAPKWTQERVHVALPKFAIEHKVTFNRILENLGVTTAFTGDADFSGIAGKKGDLAISNVIQKSFINVTESGTEAAAASAASIVVTLSLPAQRKLYNFKVDRPFLFYVTRKPSDLVLFIGAYNSPV